MRALVRSAEPAWWRYCVRHALRHPPRVIDAESFVRRVPSGSGDPAVFDCGDEKRYFVKGTQTRRAAVTDQIVGRVGMVIGAPVANVVLVNVPNVLTENEPALYDATDGGTVFEPGLGHGSEEIYRCEDRHDVMTYGHGENRDRFALLAVLYGLFQASDHQYLYERQAPRRAWSVDHGRFLPGGHEWTRETLRAARPAELDETIMYGADVSDARLRRAASSLRLLTDERIAQAVAAPPKCWGVSFLDRVALAMYLATRRDRLLALAAASA